MSTELSPKEKELYTDLLEIEDMCTSLIIKVDSLKNELNKAQDELSNTRRNMIQMQEENQRLKETLQTWKDRMSSILSQFNNIN